MLNALKWLLVALLILTIGAFAYGYAPDTDGAAMQAEYGQAPSRYIQLEPGLRVHVRDQGKQDGPAILLIHGSNASLHTWEPWVARLARDYRVVTFDLPGHGLTGRDPTGRYDNARYVNIVARVMEKLGIAHAVIGGNSMGGGVGWRFALAHPEMTDALILVDASGAPESKPRDLPIGFRLARMPVIKELAEFITPRSMFESSLKTSVYDPAFVTDAQVDRYWELNRYPGNRRATMTRFAMPVQAGTAAQLRQINKPTLILWGEEDNLIPVSAGRWFAEHLPDSRLIIYPKTGHIPMEEQAERSADEVLLWLRSLSPGLKKAA